ncbi:glycerol-3-phosphate acyltransferase, chloroplastic isoform X1 [Senna tora]|uniref:glycerol-3-phosphate 1-O-acyltransferase n=1 Tax=Senna tora TaxID=362788 RepID=A0A834TVB8_9FABA|nr:glycerol-3-phosphate acyltransferase, chloroplastic isoform X1 [Senna tora]
MGKEGDLWDDSALINAFNQAISTYKIIHSSKNKDNSSEMEKVTGSTEEIDSKSDSENLETTRDAEEKSSLIAPDLAETSNSSYLEENNHENSQATQPCLDSSSGQNIEHSQEAHNSYPHTQDVDDYNRLVGQYYELEEQRQKILEQLNQYGGWNYQYTAAASNSGVQYSNSQAYPMSSCHVSDSYVHCLCCDCCSQCLLLPCTLVPSCTSGGTCVGKPVDDCSVAICPEKSFPHEDDKILKTAIRAAERAMSTVKTTISGDSDKKEDEDRNQSELDRPNGSDPDLTIVLNAWYSAGFHTGKKFVMTYENVPKHYRISEAPEYCGARCLWFMKRANPTFRGLNAWSSLAIEYLGSMMAYENVPKHHRTIKVLLNAVQITSPMPSTMSMFTPLSAARANSLCPSNNTMLILSSSAPSPSPTFFPPSSPRVFSSSFSSSSSSSFSPKLSSIPFRSTARIACSCSLNSLKIRAKEDVFPTNDSPDNMATSLSPRTFLNARTEEELLLAIRKEAEAGSLPSNVASGMEELYQNYKSAIIKGGHPRADELILSNMTIALDRIYLDVEDPFIFEPHHKAKRDPFDYYMFGQNYIRPLIDFRLLTNVKAIVMFPSSFPGNSYVGNISLFYEMEEKLKQREKGRGGGIGSPKFPLLLRLPCAKFKADVYACVYSKLPGHNIILVSNHQTEADPAVIALLLETACPYIAENMTYVAGDRVVTDPLCKPFSMGRNLICVYSKKHMFDVPELVEMKRKANTRSLKEMAVLLRGGSQIVWFAPSGGRDRSDPQTGEFLPATLCRGEVGSKQKENCKDCGQPTSLILFAHLSLNCRRDQLLLLDELHFFVCESGIQAPFDASSVDNMRRLAEYSNPPGHIYPLAILCHDIMPPPQEVEKEIGEKRIISFHGVGVSVAPEISFSKTTVSCESPEKAKEVYSQEFYNSVTQQYNVLKSAIHGQKGLEASTPNVSLSQPWI